MSKTAMELTSMADNLKETLARAFAHEMVDSVIPMFSSLELNEQYASMKIEAERLMDHYAHHLAEMCKKFDRIAHDAINSSTHPNILIR